MSTMAPMISAHSNNSTPLYATYNYDPAGKTDYPITKASSPSDTSFLKQDSSKTAMTDLSSNASSSSSGKDTGVNGGQQAPKSPVQAPKSPVVAPGVVAAGGVPAIRRGPLARGPPAPTAHLLVQPRIVAKVIKGEILNVVNVMRGDSRYISPLRFVEELPSDEHHPLLSQMRDLHISLSEWETTHSPLTPPEPRLYLPPFCAAVKGRDISAGVTGAALHALHKFLSYGFFGMASGQTAMSPDDADGQGFATIAHALLNCTFEESPAPPHVAVATAVAETLSDPRGSEAVEANTEEPDATALIVAPNNRDDEQVVLKLLELCALVVRTASHILSTDLTVGLLAHCLHVSHRAKRASPLLKSAAMDASGQILVQVLTPVKAPGKGDDAKQPPPRPLASREPVLARLIHMLNPQQEAPPSDESVVKSLTLITIALEVLPEGLSPSEIDLMKFQLCKYLLHWSRSEDLLILSHTLKVFFELFQRLRNPLKIQLEVFLTGVHLRILEHSKSQEEKEIVLENLLAYIKEPGLVKEFFLNYDCDIQCTNVFESICSSLGAIAAPSGYKGAPGAIVNKPSSAAGGPTAAIAEAQNALAIKAAAAAAEVPVSTLTALALDGLLTILDSIAIRVGSKSSPDAASDSGDTAKQKNQISEEQLQKRRQKKSALAKVAIAFNRNPDGQEWLQIGKDIGIMDGSPKSVAKMFYSAPGLDKDLVGNYLGRGPAESFPFEHDVRVSFAQEFQFHRYMNFASALRLFLSKFRMPGEAQCIDRFMEVFSKELYRQQGKTSVFRNSDAIFVLAFSTIMLNTDQHNPTLKNVNRMTCEQFIRNNRGLNDGNDLPEEMLRDLYEQIKHSEIQVQRDVTEFMGHSDAADADDFASAWENLSGKVVAPPMFSAPEDARINRSQLGLLEKDMFLCLAKPALKTCCSAFVRSWDDSTVVDTLKGFEQLAKVSTYYNIDKLLNEILKFLLSHGRDYIVGCVTLEYAGISSGAPINQDPSDDETMSIVDQDSPIPQVILKAREIAPIDSRRADVSGAAAYRGLLVLNMALKIVRALFPRVREAWSQLIEVLCALRDARALPQGLADLDDFADSNGSVLPLSWFAHESQQRLEKFYKGKSDKEEVEEEGWLGRLNIFAVEERPKTKPVWQQESIAPKGELSINSRTLLQIAEKTEVNVFLLLTPKTPLPIVKQAIVGLLEAVDQFPLIDNPVYEQNTAFALELATRALLASKERANELFPPFLAKVESIAAKIKANQEVLISVPFLVERVVVTCLRACIHLYANAQVRPKLHKALYLLRGLPDDYFIWYISDRMACGLAIILRQSFYMFKRPEEWQLMGDLFDLLSYYEEARGLVFDGIASTIEFAVPPMITKDLYLYESKLSEKPVLSIQGCNVLGNNLFKFVYGTYNEDYTLAVPAMLCIEKVYNHLSMMLQILEKNDMSRHPEDPITPVPEKDLWYRVAMMLYTVCSAPDTEQSKHGWEAFQRHVMGVEVSDLPDDVWTKLLSEMVNLQPPIETDVPRMNSFSVLGQVMIKVLPSLTLRGDNWPALTEITKTFAIIAEENFWNGRRGLYIPLYDYTLKTVTYLHKQLSKPEFAGEKRYAAWASEHLNGVLERLEDKEIGGR